MYFCRCFFFEKKYVFFFSRVSRTYDIWFFLWAAVFFFRSSHSTLTPYLDRNAARVYFSSGPLQKKKAVDLLVLPKQGKRRKRRRELKRRTKGGKRVKRGRKRRHFLRQLEARVTFLWLQRCRCRTWHKLPRVSKRTKEKRDTFRFHLLFLCAAFKI